MGNLAQRYGMTQAPPDPKLKLPAATADAPPPPAPKPKAAELRAAVAKVEAILTTVGKARAKANAAKSNTVSNTQSNRSDSPAKFDKAAYQRELMRKRRAAAKATIQNNTKTVD